MKGACYENHGILLPEFIESELENRHFTAKISVVLDAESWVHTDFLSSLGC